ncbi:MAG: PAS domain-containing protein, partial [Verrucomicrobiales bacterium]
MNSSLHLLDTLPAMIWRSRTDAKWDYFNRTWLSFTGRSLQQECGHGWVHGIHPGDREHFVQIYLDHFDGTESFETEIRLRRYDGDHRWIQLQCQPIYGENDVFTGYLGHGRDITALKRNTEDLREARHRFDTIVGISPVGIFRIDLEGCCHYASPRWSELTGIAIEEALGCGWLDSIHPDDRTATETQLRDCFNRMESIDAECRLLSPDGTVAWALLQLRPEIDEAGISHGYFGTLTELARDRSRADRPTGISRFESLGILAGDIAHDFNNLLTPILLNLSASRSDLRNETEGSELEKRILEAQEAAQRARGLTQQLLTFAEGGSPVMKPQCLSGLLFEAVRFALHGSRVAVESDIDPELASVMVDAGQFNVVIQNLIINATQAIDVHGCIRISATDVDGIDHPGIEPCQGPFIRIQIADDGHGIDSERLKRIFEPYYSTHVNGNGLGLTTALSIVRKHSGHLAVESTTGEGTVVSIFLPATDTPVDDHTPLTSATGGAGDIRLLIMDDEELILSSMSAMLTTLGYQVDTA